jgi:hypothetical protein
MRHPVPCAQRSDAPPGVPVETTSPG